MTTLTVKVKDDKDLSVLEEILNRFGMDYSVDEEMQYQFSQAEINGFLQTKADFLSDKTTAKDWHTIDRELNSAFD